MQFLLTHFPLFRRQNFFSVIVAVFCIAFVPSIITFSIAADNPTVTPSAEASASPAPSPTPVAATSAKMTAGYVFWLCFLATAGLVICWISFWSAVKTHPEKVTGVLGTAAFFQVVTVMGVVAAVVVLSICDKLDGQLAVSVLSGIVGYVLGSLTSKGAPTTPSGNAGGGGGGQTQAQQSVTQAETTPSTPVPPTSGTSDQHT